MRNDFYPEGHVEALLQTGEVSSPTKDVLIGRMQTPAVTRPSFFEKSAFATLKAVAGRLMPQPSDRTVMIDLAGILDTNLARGSFGNGWRYDAMPPDGDAFRLGLQGINEVAETKYGAPFTSLPPSVQDEILSAVQLNSMQGEVWQQLPSSRFFEELLAAFVEIYYSHPAGRSEIGDASVADAQGWHSLGLNTREKREPKAL